jgi:hypothetical protein
MEIMGSVDSGIHAMCWSPDQDLVVLVTGKNNQVLCRCLIGSILTIMH